MTKRKTKTKTWRFTMDIPIDLHHQISEIIEETGQTMKGYFVRLARKDVKTHTKTTDE